MKANRERPAIAEPAPAIPPRAPSNHPSPWYRFLQLHTYWLFALAFRLRVTGRHHVPVRGGALLVANHQSFLDPVLVGTGLRRPVCYVARDSLFRKPALAALIRSLGAFPIRREGLGLSGVKEMLRRLRNGKLVLVFPEGTRTYDGRIQPLQPGFVGVAARARAPIVPVGIAGAFEAWPRSRRLPRPQPIHVHFGEPISAAGIEGGSHATATLDNIAGTLEACRQVAARALAHAANPIQRPWRRGGGQGRMG